MDNNIEKIANEIVKSVNDSILVEKIANEIIVPQINYGKEVEKIAKKISSDIEK